MNTQERNDIFISDISIDDDDISTMIIQGVPMFKPEVNKDIDFQIFPLPSTDDRSDFKIKPDKEDLLVYKSPTLTAVNTITRGQLCDALNNISNLDDLATRDYNNDTNIDDLSDDLKRKAKQEKITQIRDFLKRFDTKTREEIEKNLHENGLLTYY